MKSYTRSLHSGRTVGLLFALMALAAFGEELVDYKQTVRSGIASMSWPKEMEALFGTADHFITEYGFTPGPKQWNSEVYFAGRYRLTLQVDVSIDYKKHTIERHVNPPVFYLSEIESLTREKGEVVGAKIAHQWRFDEAQWKALIKAKGDWSVIGLPVRKDRPIPGFEEYVKGWRAPRVQVK